MKFYARWTALLATSMFVACGPVHADAWTGTDKDKHVIAGALVGTAVAAYTQDRVAGAVAGAVVGAAKELYDSTGRGQVSAKDLIVTAIGGAAGAYLGGFFVVVKDRQAVLYISRSF